MLQLNMGAMVPQCCKPSSSVAYRHNFLHLLDTLIVLKISDKFMLKSTQACNRNK